METVKFTMVSFEGSKLYRHINIILFCNVTSLVLVDVRQHYRITHLQKCTESWPTSLLA